MKLGRIILLLSLIVSVSTLFASLARACGGYLENRVAQRIREDELAHQMMFTTGQDLSASGDFDGDGRLDEAFFTGSTGRYLLVVCLDDGKRAVKLATLQRIIGFGIRTAPPGVYVAACAHGYGNPCRPGQVSELKLHHDAIEYIRYERFSGLHYWSNGKFKRFYLSD